MYNQKFTIPKRNSDICTVKQLNNNDNEALDDIVMLKFIETQMKQSVLNKADTKITEDVPFNTLLSSCNFKLINIKSVNNLRLEDLYRQRCSRTLRTDICREGRAKVKYERYLYYFCASKTEMDRICQEGFQCPQPQMKTSSTTEDCERFPPMLGRADKGIYLLKQIDVGLQYMYTKRSHLLQLLQQRKLYCIMAKVFIKKFEFITPKIKNGEKLAGTQNANCHYSRTIQNSEQSHMEQLINSLCYVYDYNENDTYQFEQQPTNLVPYAILEFEANRIINCNPVRKREEITKRSRFHETCHNNYTELNTNFIPLEKEVSQMSNDFRNLNKNQGAIQRPPRHQQQQNIKKVDQIITIPRQNIKKVDQIITIPQQNIKKEEHQLKKNKKRKKSIFSSDSDSDKEKGEEEKEEVLDMYELYLRLHGNDIDEVEVTNEIIPKWRIMYERTGNMNYKFKGIGQMKAKIEDVRQMGLKFMDAAKTRLNVSDPTNKMIFQHRNIKLKTSNTVNIYATID